MDEFIALLTYIQSVSETSAGDLHELFAQVGPDAEEAYVTTADMLRTEGRTEGRTQGRAEGRTEGRVETLRQLIEIKFGPLPAGALHQLHTASTDQLEAWTERILTAETLNDVLR